MDDLTFAEFIAENYRNAWVTEPGFLQLYVRRSTKYRGTDFDLANMNSPDPGRGSLTAFLDKYEPQYSFYIENVHNLRLLQYFIKRGYIIVDHVNISMKKIPKESA